MSDTLARKGPPKIEERFVRESEKEQDWSICTHCRTLQHAATRVTRERSNSSACINPATHCNVCDMREGTTVAYVYTLQHTATYCYTCEGARVAYMYWQICIHCNTLQHVATRVTCEREQEKRMYNAATRSNTLQHV